MNLTTLLQMLTAIFLNACGHIFLKKGMMAIGGINPQQLLTHSIKIFTTPFVLLGLFSYVSSVALYMVVLSKTDLSFAYPLMMSLAYILVIVVSWLLFKEPFSTLKWIGIALIFIGVWFVGKK